MENSEGYKYIQNIKRYAALNNARDFSIKFLLDLQNRLKVEKFDNIETIAVCGSLSRLEASVCSDVDHVVIIRDEHKDIKSDIAKLQKHITDLGATEPNRGGVFVQPRTTKELIEKLGQFDEDSDVFSKRMLLLMESTPIYNSDCYKKVMEDVYSRYAKIVKIEPAKEFTLLLNDLIRYFRSICLNYESKFWGENINWSIRNIKLRHSRVLIYMGLLSLIGESSKHGNDKYNWLFNQLNLTPLDRIAMVYRENQDDGFHKVIELYNTFLGKISCKENREALNGTNYEERYKCQLFAELKSNSDAFISELTRFIFAQRGQWSERFFEYLLF
jgi:predicted nucleotidyltransferase